MTNSRPADDVLPSKTRAPPCQECPLAAVQQAAAAGDWPLATRLVLDDLAISALLEEPAGGPLTEALARLRLELARRQSPLTPAPASGRRPGPPGGADPVIVEELSAREREVLRLLAGMLTTAEAADELHISVNTVKAHLKSIYRKLAAGRRSEAVRRAKQLRMI